jgi:hypothetical protein
MLRTTLIMLAAAAAVAIPLGAHAAQPDAGSQEPKIVRR